MVNSLARKPRLPLTSLFWSASVLRVFKKADVILVMAVSMRVLIGSESLSFPVAHLTVLASVVEPSSGGGDELYPLIDGAVNGLSAKGYLLFYNKSGLGQWVHATIFPHGMDHRMKAILFTVSVGVLAAVFDSIALFVLMLVAITVLFEPQYDIRDVWRCLRKRGK